MADIVTRLGDMVTRTEFKDGKIIQHRSQDDTPIFDENLRAYNDAPGKFERRKSEFVRVAQIPMSVYVHIVCDLMGIPPHRMFRLTPDETKRRNSYLNSSDYKKLRTAPGRI